MNLGENRIEMRIPRSAWFLAIYVPRIPKPFLIEFITASRVPATRCCWSERSGHANPDMVAGVVFGRSSILTGRVDNLFRLLAKLRPCRVLRARGKRSKAHRSRTPPFGLPSRSARLHHTDESIGQCSDDLGASRYHPSLSLTPASPLWSPARPRRGPPGGQQERRPDEEAHCSEERPCVGQRKVDQGIGTRQHKARDRRRHEGHRT
jgi:hypothetical protein